jgi:hypothetical protein
MTAQTGLRRVKWWATKDERLKTVRLTREDRKYEVCTIINDISGADLYVYKMNFLGYDSEGKENWQITTHRHYKITDADVCSDTIYQLVKHYSRGRPFCLVPDETFEVYQDLPEFFKDISEGVP